MADLAKAMYPDGPSTILGNQMAEAGKAKPGDNFSGNWWQDPNLDWNTVPVGKQYDWTGEVPLSMYDAAHSQIAQGKSIVDAYKDIEDRTQSLIEKHKLKPGDLFTMSEPRGPKTYMYMGPGHPRGQNYFLFKKSEPKPEMM